MFQKDMKISLLLDFYGDFLSDRKREILEMYYNEDLSLAEIAEEAGISRQGVRDSIKKSEKELLSLEETLGLAARFASIKREIEDIAGVVSEVIERTEDEKSKSALEAVKERLNGLEI